ncbi:hypothetical protein Aperf_G00000088036 [Anoplocephala perfoliata]
MENIIPEVGTISTPNEKPPDDEPVRRKPPIIEAILSELGFGWFQVRMIVILGVAHSTDTMETIIQAILGPSLRCDWRLSADYIALLTSLVFLGSCIGAVPLGYAADVFGRRSVCLLSCLVLMYLSWLCAISPTFAWIASLRFISGLFIGGVLTAGSSLISETMPSKFQAPGQLITNNFEALIGVLTAGIGLGCLEGGLNWRIFVFFTTAPLALCAIFLVFFTPESPVYLYCKKQNIEAAEVLDKIAVANGRISKDAIKNFSFLGRILEADETEDFRISKIGIKEVYTLLIRRRPWLLPLLLILNFAWGFIIYGGTTILPVELATGPRTCLQNLGTLNVTILQPIQQTPGGAPFECCKPLPSGGLLSLPLAYSLVALFKQKLPIAQMVAFLITAILLFIQGSLKLDGDSASLFIPICTEEHELLAGDRSFCMPASIHNIFFFAARGVAAAGNGLIGIYSSNIYQARVRSLATGLCAAAFRLGILAAPYVGQVLLQDRSTLEAIMTFVGIAIVGAIGSLLLPKLRVMHTASNSSSTGTRRNLPPLRSLFHTPSAADFSGNLPRSSRIPSSTKPATNAPITVDLSMDPGVSVIGHTYQELRRREQDARRPGNGELVIHEDFVPRNAKFEVDA